MSAASTLPMTADRARAPLDRTRQHRRAVASARRKLAHARNFRFTLASAAVLAGALAFGFYSGMPALLRAVPQTTSNDSFAVTRVGKVRTHYRGDICRQYDFDNTTSAAGSQSYVSCSGNGVVGPAALYGPQGRTRLEQISEAFRR